MKLILYAVFANAALSFAPKASPPTRTRSLVVTQSIVDDWKTFFSKEETNHRQVEHDAELREMFEAQQEILERRRDPKKMAQYHMQEEARHEKFDHQHDVDLEAEWAKEWTPSDTPLVKDTYDKHGAHNIFDDFASFFSKEAREERAVQHHIEMLEIEDAEKDILSRRRDPGAMKRYKNQEKARHERLDKQHEIEEALQFAEEEIEEGQNFMNDVLKNIFGGSKKKQKQ